MGGLPRSCHFSHCCQFLQGTLHAILTFQFASTVQSRANVIRLGVSGPLGRKSGCALRASLKLSARLLSQR